MSTSEHGSPLRKGTGKQHKHGYTVPHLLVIRLISEFIGFDVLIAQVRVRVEGRDQQTFGIKAASCERNFID